MNLLLSYASITALLSLHRHCYLKTAITDARKWVVKDLQRYGSDIEVMMDLIFELCEWLEEHDMGSTLDERHDLNLLRLRLARDNTIDCEGRPHVDYGLSTSLMYVAMTHIEKNEHSQALKLAEEALKV